MAAPRKPIKPATQQDVKVFLNGLVGQGCWRVGQSYGDELILDLGRKNTEPAIWHPRLGWWRYEYGDWHVGSQGSDWHAIAVGDESPFASSREPIDDAERKLKRLEGRAVRSVTVSEALVLRLEFDDGTVLTFSPSEPDEGVPHWNVFGPDHLVLVAGPGSRCVITRSDAPDENEKARH